MGLLVVTNTGESFDGSATGLHTHSPPDTATATLGVGRAYVNNYDGARRSETHIVSAH